MVKIRPPGYFFIFLGLQVIFHYFLPIYLLLEYPINLIGIFFVVFGIVINVWAWFLFVNMSTAFVPEERPKEMVTSGPFMFSRNPMYLGMVSVLLGTAVVFGSLIAFLFPVMMFLVLNYWYIPYEEMKMISEFREKYSVYMKSTRRWI